MQLSMSKGNIYVFNNQKISSVNPLQGQPQQVKTLFDKFASHLLEYCIFHTGIIQSLILVTHSVQNSLFTEAYASTVLLSVFGLACHVIRVWKQLSMYIIWMAISGGTV